MTKQVFLKPKANSFPIQMKGVFNQYGIEISVIDRVGDGAHPESPNHRTENYPFLTRRFT
jgi:hypothetical protein